MKHVRSWVVFVVTLLVVAAAPRAAFAEATCYRLPFNNPNLADGWGSTCCGRTSPHRGVDFPQPTNTPIPAIAKGIVRVKAYSSCLGNVVVVEHPDGMFSGYCHMNAQSTLAVGASIAQSDIVGKIGRTGTCATGPHLHLTMSPQQGGWASGTTVDPYKYIEAHQTCNQAPKGVFDAAGCDALTGWAQDPDAPTLPIDVHLYIGGPAGDANAYGMPLHANLVRNDLCVPLGSCNHGFSAPPPLSFFDGLSHPVYAYAIDAKGGPNTALGSKPLLCQALPIPMTRIGVVRRRVAGADVLAAWHVASAQIATLTDAMLAAVPLGPDLVATPALVTVAGDPMIYLREYETVRPIPTPSALQAWALDASTAKATTALELATDLRGADWTSTPFLAKGQTGDVYVIDAPPPLWAELVEDDIPTEMAAGATADVTLHFRNRGSLTWAPGAVELAATPRNVASPLCDPTWPSCTRAGAFEDSVAPTTEATVKVRLRAPTEAGSVTTCFGLVTGTHWFSAPGANGPSDGELCRTLSITPADDSASADGCACSTVDARGPARRKDVGWLMIGVLGVMAWARRRRSHVAEHAR